MKGELLKRVRDYQIRMASKVIKDDILNDSNKRYVCGVDVAYRADKAYASSVIVDLSKEEVCISNSICRVYIPYISTYLFLREGAPMINALNGLHARYDVIMVDGNGMLHPRLFGLACYIGLIMDKPTIGVSKSLLHGCVVDDDNNVMLNGMVVGKALRLKNKNVYVSIGNKVSLDTAVDIVKTSCYPSVQEALYPLPLLLADRYANALRISQA